MLNNFTTCPVCYRSNFIKKNNYFVCPNNPQVHYDTMHYAFKKDDLINSENEWEQIQLEKYIISFCPDNLILIHLGKTSEKICRIEDTNITYSYFTKDKTVNINDAIELFVQNYTLL